MLNALLVTHLPNIFYLSGFTGSSGVLLVEQSSATLFTDTRYSIQAAEQAGGTGVKAKHRPRSATSRDWRAPDRS